jgi:hypothetical protein
VGGPVAVADVGDFLLENDQIRINILGAHDSPGPGVFGGSIVDVDIRRDRLGFEDQAGHDRFAELFPVSNLIVPDPDPTKMQVTVLADGSDGAEAAIRVEGEGAPLFAALGILHDELTTLDLLFQSVKTAMRFRTDYIVRPGERHVLIRTTLMLEDMGGACPIDPSTCAAASACEYGLAGDPSQPYGCTTCACAEPASLDLYTAPASVFDQILGDPVSKTPHPVVQGGVVAGDFVFFGNENDVFAPGVGFDLDKTLHEAFYAGQNTFLLHGPIGRRRRRGRGDARRQHAHLHERGDRVPRRGQELRRGRRRVRRAARVHLRALPDGRPGRHRERLVRRVARARHAHRHRPGHRPLAGDGAARDEGARLLLHEPQPGQELAVPRRARGRERRLHG